MKQWIEIWHTQKEMVRIYEKGAGKKIVDHSKLKYEHVSEDKVNVNDLYMSIDMHFIVIEVCYLL